MGQTEKTDAQLLKELKIGESLILGIEDDDDLYFRVLRIQEGWIYYLHHQDKEKPLHAQFIQRTMMSLLDALGKDQVGDKTDLNPVRVTIQEGD